MMLYTSSFCAPKTDILLFKIVHLWNMWAPKCDPGSKNREELGVIASFKVIVVQKHVLKTTCFREKNSDCTKSFKRATI